LCTPPRRLFPIPGRWHSKSKPEAPRLLRRSGDVDGAGVDLLLAFSRGAWGAFALAVVLMLVLSFLTAGTGRERRRIVVIATRQHRARGDARRYPVAAPPQSGDSISYGSGIKRELSLQRSQIIA
jgi:hypothetical protein